MITEIITPEKNWPDQSLYYLHARRKFFCHFNRILPDLLLRLATGNHRFLRIMHHKFGIAGIENGAV